jgi:hypothetical protein
MWIGWNSCANCSTAVKTKKKKSPISPRNYGFFWNVTDVTLHFCKDLLYNEIRILVESFSFSPDLTTARRKPQKITVQIYWPEQSIQSAHKIEYRRMS